jgi:hypothetical protein
VKSAPALSVAVIRHGRIVTSITVQPTAVWWGAKYSGRGPMGEGLALVRGNHSLTELGQGLNRVLDTGFGFGVAGGRR